MNWNKYNNKIGIKNKEKQENIQSQKLLSIIIKREIG